MTEPNLLLLLAGIPPELYPGSAVRVPNDMIKA
jgi:hypothetical protein